MRAAIFLGTSFLVACGSVSNNPDASHRDGAGPDSGTGPRCDPGRPFGAPSPVGGGVNTPSAVEDSGRLLPGENDLLFARAPSGQPDSYDIYLATRSGGTGDFAASAPLSGVNTALNDSSPTATADFLTLYLSSAMTDPNGGRLYGIYVATRTAITQPFGPIARVPIDQAQDQAYYPYVTPDGAAIYFSRPGVLGGSDIRWTQREGGGFAPSQAIAELNAPGEDAWPVISDDQLTIYFGSDRATAGDYDIYVASRTSAAVQFGVPVRVAELSTSDWETPTWISPDGCALYFTRGGAGGSNVDVFVAVRGR